MPQSPEQIRYNYFASRVKYIKNLNSSGHYIPLKTAKNKEILRSVNQALATWRAKEAQS